MIKTFFSCECSSTINNLETLNNNIEIFEYKHSFLFQLPNNSVFLKDWKSLNANVIL